MERHFISSYQFQETQKTPEAPFDFILITGYADEAAYQSAEENFQILIQASGGLNLLNQKKVITFRKSVTVKEKV